MAKSTNPLPSLIRASAWDDCKVAFAIDEDRLLWRRYNNGRLSADLPAGWSLCEVDGAGARLVAVFRVEGAPTADDGRKVLSMLRRIRAVSRLVAV